MTSFQLAQTEGVGPSVKVTLPDSFSEEELLAFSAFTDWNTTLQKNLDLQRTKGHPFHEKRYKLESINVQSVDKFERDGAKHTGFVKLEAKIQNQNKTSTLPGVAFLRGGSVAVLMVLIPNDNIHERYVVMTEQPRIPAGSLQFLEIPAGMLDGEKHVRLKAKKEIKEETNFEVEWEDLIDLTELALKDSQIRDKDLKNAMYPSPGGSDEFIKIYLWEKIDRQTIEDLRKNLHREKTQEDTITLRFCPYEELWREGARDAKTLAAWALYEGLSRSGDLQREYDEREAKAKKSSARVGDREQ